MLDLRVDIAQRLRRDSGQALTEYALILFFVAIVSVAVLWAVGVDVAYVLDGVESSLNGDNASGEPNYGNPNPAPVAP